MILTKGEVCITSHITHCDVSWYMYNNNRGISLIFAIGVVECKNTLYNISFCVSTGKQNNILPVP